MRTILATLAGLGLLLALLAGWCFREATGDPLVRRAEVAMPGLEKPMRIALISDIHIGNPAMGPERLTRIVGQINALKPDLVVIAGDFIFGHDPRGAARPERGEAMIAPLRQLRAPLGVAAVLGNHDYWTGAQTVRGQLARAGITLLENSAVVRGPIALGGIADDFTGHADVLGTYSAARFLGRPMVFLTHSPDVAPDLPADARLLLAGHTHCGQAMLFGMRVAPEVSRYGARYRCGLVREGNRTVVVTAGLGASGVPLRLGAPPDLWLLTLVPVAMAPTQKSR
ncbi:metallophosphoesterase [Sphingomonas sp. HITSZ_GF]|uniref:metallophosphoesterase n=1 Tax=Sphingomonas sp. HITSZ_GF TaxID=3037247 RepID=UPI00240D8587|nr:metallophosphoesterase [Sphingomonas sp. HITSZ_GF]MDG2533320.1 metallophosphoesterase [Sphingomonas sp. HITSZ_GF]